MSGQPVVISVRRSRRRRKVANGLGKQPYLGGVGRAGGIAIELCRQLRERVVPLGTQSHAGDSPPGAPHQFKLDPGDYDVYVENGSGKGRPTAMVSGIHLESGAKVEKTVPLD